MTIIKPKKQILIKFTLLCCLMLGYFGYLSYEYDILTGGVTALLTWSFLFYAPLLQMQAFC